MSAISVYSVFVADFFCALAELPDKQNNSIKKISWYAMLRLGKMALYMLLIIGQCMLDVFSQFFDADIRSFVIRILIQFDQ